MKRRDFLRGLTAGTVATGVGITVVAAENFPDEFEYKGWNVSWTGWKANIPWDELKPSSRRAQPPEPKDNTLCGQWLAWKSGVNRKGLFQTVPLAGAGVYNWGQTFNVKPIYDKDIITTETPESAKELARNEGAKRIKILIDWEDR